MNWTELLHSEAEDAYAMADKLMDLVDDDELAWKPATGTNWMTTGQLLLHITEACGLTFKACITGDWPQIPPEEMLMPAEKVPTVESVGEAKQRLAEDKRLALEMLATCSEEDLATRPVPVPWDPTEMVLGRRLLQMVYHLVHHKGQLFYYLKLQGEPVHTGHLWGM